MMKVKTFSTLGARRSFVYKKPKRSLGVRHLQALLLFLLLSVATVSQFSISVSLTYLKKENTVMPKLKPKLGEWIPIVFNIWTMVSSILSGFLATKMNNKSLLLTYGTINTILSYISPVLLKTYGWTPFFITRLVQITVYCLVRPCAYNLMVRWFPPTALFRVAPVVMSGIFLGMSILSNIVPQTAEGSGGWESIYYFSANCCLVWTIAFAGFGAQDPNSCWYISQEETLLVDGVTGFRARGTFRKNVPFKKILTCLPLYATAICYGVQWWVASVSFQLMPKILKQKYGMGKIQAEMLFGGPFFPVVIIVALISFLANYLVQRGVLTVKTLRFISNSIGLCGIGSCFVIASSTESLSSLLAVYYLGFFLDSFVHLGFHMNVFDLSPNFAGMLYAWTVVIVQFIAIIQKQLVKFLTDKDNFDISWRAMFSVTGVLLILGNLFFTMFGSVQVQSFNVYFDEEAEEL